MFLLQQGPLMHTTLLNYKKHTVALFCQCTLLFLLLGINQISAKALADFSQEKNNVKLTVHQLSQAQMRKLFNCYNPVKIVRLTSHYKALEITIENKTEQEYVLDRNNIGLQLEDNLIVKHKIKTNPAIIPIFTALASSAVLISGIGFAVIPSIIAGTVLGITTLNLNTKQSNKFSTKNIRTKVLNTQHPSFIASFSKIKKIIFVTSKQLKNNFQITLEPIHDGQKVFFDISLKK